MTFRGKIMFTAILYFFGLVLNIGQMYMMAQLLGALSDKNI